MLTDDPPVGHCNMGAGEKVLVNFPAAFSENRERRAVADRPSPSLSPSLLLQIPPSDDLAHFL